MGQCYGPFLCKQQVTRTLDRDKANQPKKIEKLFVWKGSEAQ